MKDFKILLYNYYIRNTHSCCMVGRLGSDYFLTFVTPGSMISCLSFLINNKQCDKSLWLLVRLQYTTVTWVNLLQQILYRAIKWLICQWWVQQVKSLLKYNIHCYIIASRMESIIVVQINVLWLYKVVKLKPDQPK